MGSDGPRVGEAAIAVLTFDSPALTQAECPNGRAAATYNLTLADDKLRFEINLGAAVRTRLKISAKVMALAKIVNAEP